MAEVTGALAYATVFPSCGHKDLRHICVLRRNCSKEPSHVVSEDQGSLGMHLGQVAEDALAGEEGGFGGVKTLAGQGICQQG